MTRARNSANLASHGNLFVDIANDRTGIGSVVPGQSLHVAGTAGFHADTTFTGDLYSTTWDRSENSLVFNDNAKVAFGNGSKATIRHSGSQLFVNNNQGNLYLRVGDENGVLIVPDADVRLFYNGTQTFATADYGVNVTGTTDTDGLVVSGVATVTTMNVTGVLTYDDVASVDSVGIVTARQGIHIDDSIVHIGDTNTKIRFPAADTFSVETAGSERLNLTATRLSLGTNIRVNDYISHQSNDSIGVKFYNASGNNKYVGMGAEDDGTSPLGQTFKIMRQGSAVTRLLIDSSGNLKFDGADFIINDAIEHNNDPNTKIRFPSNDIITFETAGSERLRIDQNGNIGVNAVPRTNGTLYTTVDHFLVIGDTDTGIAQDGDGQFEIWANNQEIANYNIGGITFTKGLSITGNTSTTGNLTVGGNSDITGTLDVDGAVRIGNSSGNLGINCNPSSSGDFGGNTSRIAIGDADTGIAQIQDGHLGLYSNNNEVLRIKSAGVLIGTTTEGTAQADNLTVADTGHSGITIRSGTSKNGNLYFSDGTSGADEYRGAVQYNHTDNYLRFYTDGGEKLRINSSGHVVPGSDSSYDLGLTGTRWRNVYADTLYGNGANLTAVNATTLDSIDSANFLRTDVTQTASNRITFTSSSLQLSGHYFHGVYSGTTNYIHLYPYGTSSGNASVTNIRAFNGSGGADTLQITGGSATGLKWRGYTIWTAENDGSGSTLNADTVDGLQASQFLRNDADSTIQAVLTTRRVSVQANHDIRLANGSWTGDTTSPKIQAHSDALYIVGGASGIRFRENNQDRVHIDGSGNMLPATDSAYSLGTTGNRWTHTFTDALTVTNNVSVGGDVTVSGGSGALTVTANSDIRFSAGNWTGDAGYKIQAHSGALYIQAPIIRFRSNNGSDRWYVQTAGHFEPSSDNSYDIGSSSKRVRNVYSTFFYGSAAGLTANTLPTAESGISAVGNFGQWESHGTYTNFNTEPAYWGWSYVQGNTNAPNTSSGQWYRCRLSLGSDYGKGSDTGDYSMEMTIPRTQDGGQGQMWVRPIENGVEGTWMEVGSRPYNSVIPRSDNAIDLGSSSIRWANLYTADAHFNNIGTGGNDIDGTEGSWTLQEAEDTVYMINRKNGKRYKIKMEEV